MYRTESAGGCVQPWCASAVGKVWIETVCVAAGTQTKALVKGKWKCCRIMRFGTKLWTTVSCDLLVHADFRTNDELRFLKGKWITSSVEKYPSASHLHHTPRITLALESHQM